MQHRHCDMDVFFQHENHPFPSSLSEGGKLRFGKKSDLLKIITFENKDNSPDPFDVKLRDGAAIVHLLSTAGVTNFEEYADRVFISYLIKLLDTCQRIDIVWDTYIASTLKETTREKRGKGIRRKVEGENKLPLNWYTFPRD